MGFVGDLLGLLWELFWFAFWVFLSAIMVFGLIMLIVKFPLVCLGVIFALKLLKN